MISLEIFQGAIAIITAALQKYGHDSGKARSIVNDASFLLDLYNEGNGDLAAFTQYAQETAAIHEAGWPTDAVHATLAGDKAQRDADLERLEADTPAPETGKSKKSRGFARLELVGFILLAALLGAFAPAVFAQLADSAVANSAPAYDLAKDTLTFAGFVGAAVAILRRTPIPNEWITAGMPVLSVPLFMWIYGGMTKEGFVAGVVAAAAANGIGAATDPKAASDAPAKPPRG